jgi:predicted MFS family arabinose efflux permease
MIWSRDQRRRVESLLGGRARIRVVVLLAAVPAMASADLGLIGALARELQAAFHINRTELGLLATASSGVGALATIPMGTLADRVVRVRLLVYTVVLWSIALGIGGMVSSYLWLLLSRIALGGAIAAAGPLLASLTGDFIPADERAKVYGCILTGEILGTGIGLVAGGNIGAALSWRYAFWLLAALGFVLAVAVHRSLPEPARGGASRIPPGSKHIPHGVPAHLAGRGEPTRTGETPVSLSLWQAFGYILRIRTNRILIVASAFGYFFFAGLRTFIVVFVEQRFGIGPGEVSGLALIAGVGALVGTVSSGRLADALRRQGRSDARIVVPAVAYAATAILFVPGLLAPSLLLALPFIVMGAATLAATNPPLDAARLDLVPSWLWGRAESLRTVLRLAAESVAPVSFGVVADWLSRRACGNMVIGLRDTLVIMLLPLLINGLLVFAARRSYPADVRSAETASSVGRPTPPDRGQSGPVDGRR